MTSDRIGSFTANLVGRTIASARDYRRDPGRRPISSACRRPPERSPASDRVLDRVQQGVAPASLLARAIPGRQLPEALPPQHLMQAYHSRVDVNYPPHHNIMAEAHPAPTERQDAGGGRASWCAHALLPVGESEANE